jgi:zinc protease
MSDKNKKCFQLPRSLWERARSKGGNSGAPRGHIIPGIVAALIAFSTNAEAAPKIQHWTLDNGARVYFVEAHELPIVQLRAVFDAGSARDPQGKDGLALMTAAMLEQGAAGYDADAIARGFEDVGAEFHASADRDMAAVGLRSLVDKRLLDAALPVYTAVLTASTFPSESFERERARSLVSLAHDAQLPGPVADKAFFAALYGTHPYAHRPRGEEATVKALAREDLVAFHDRYYVGANARFVMVGDLSLADAKRIARETVGRLPAGQAAPALPDVAALEKAETRRIAFPASQSHILIGQPGVTRLDPDYFPLYVGNHILGGGGLVSRLSDEVREKHGYAYSVYSYFFPLRAAGPFELGLQTKNANRDAALKLVRAVLEKFVAEGPTPKELEAAKKNITGGFPLRLDSDLKITDNLTVVAFYDLPLTYLDDFVGRVQAVTAEQIRDAFHRRLHPARLLTVVVGGAQ